MSSDFFGVPLNDQNPRQALPGIFFDIDFCNFYITVVMYSLKQTDRFAQWESSLSDLKVRTAIASGLSRISYGLMGDVKHVGEGVQEIRIHLGPGYRVYFVIKGNEIIILLCGGEKKTQKKDISIAKELARNWKD